MISRQRHGQKGIDIYYLYGRTLLAVTDYYSNQLTVCKLRNQESQNVTNELLCISATHGLPETIICDNGPQFREPFKEFAKNYDINVITTSQYYLQRNGKAENGVKTIKRILKKCREISHLSRSFYVILIIRQVYTNRVNSLSKIIWKKMQNSVTYTKIVAENKT